MTDTTTDLDAARRAAIEQLWQTLADGDPSAARAAAVEIYHDDAVLEFPQSGERFEGRANFQAWREQYPVPVAFRLRRITGSGDVWVSEVSASYDGGPWLLGVGVLEFDGVRIRRERIYVAEPWDAPEWRAAWRAATPAE